MIQNIFAPCGWYFLLGVFCAALCAPATMVEAAAISGTVVAAASDTDQDIPISGARIFLLDEQDNIVAHGVSGNTGSFTLVAPDDAKVQAFLQGPVESDEFINTYYAFLAVAEWQPEDLADLVLEIMPRAVADEVIAQVNASPGLAPLDVSRGIITGGVEAFVDEESDEFQAVDGVTVTCTKIPTGETIEGVTVYMNDQGRFDPTLQATSSAGHYLIYNIPLDERGFANVSLRADKRGYVFMYESHARVYPYRASPEKVTIVPFEGFRITPEVSASTDADSGGGSG